MTYTIEIKIRINWVLKDMPWYGWGDDKQLYNLRTNKRLKQTMNGGSIGYWFGKRFITLKALRPMLVKCRLKNTPPMDNLLVNTGNYK